MPNEAAARSKTDPRTVRREETVGSVFVVIRTVGERTTEACRRIAEGQVAAGHVTEISERPASRAVRRGFEVGLEAGLEWTLFLDADVLLRPGGIADLVREAEAQPRSVFCAEGRVADKLLGHYRTAGVLLYRTGLLRQVLREAEITDAALRPDTHVKEQMIARGHSLHYGSTVVGVHDFEQFYVDVFRKALVHTEKHAQDLKQYAARHWQAEAACDPDLRVASWALRTRSIFEGEIRIDRRLFPDALTTLLQMARMEERAPLAPGALTAKDAVRLLDGFEVPAVYQTWRRFEVLYQKPFGRVRAMLDRYGPAKAPMHLLGKALVQAGQRLLEEAET